MTTAVPESNFGTSDFGIAQFARSLSHEGLSGLSPAGRAVPRLAEGWAWADNGMKLRVRLRPGIESHAGPLTATMVADALRSAVSDQANRARYWSLSHVTSVDVTGDAEVTLSLDRPTGALPEDLDLPLGFGPKSVGTGPFRLVAESDTESVLERFDAYYRARPDVERVVIKPYPTLRTAWASLLRGDVDMVTNVPASAVDFVRSEQVVVASFPRVYQHAIAFNSARAPFRDPAVRRALNLAIDRQRILEGVFGGRGLAATGPLWPNHWAYNRNASGYTFDADKARSLLDAAGLPLRRGGDNRSKPVRFVFTCIVPVNFVNEERIALEVEKQLYDIGVEVRFDVITPQEWAKRFQAGDFDAMLVDMISGPTFGRPFLFWHSGREQNGLNVFGYHNTEVDRLFDVLRESIDEGVVRRAAGQLQAAFDIDPPALFLAWNERTRAVSRDFQSLVTPGTDPVRALWGWTAADTRDHPPRP
jgi:peptide/nickel transport system substrate-binding protein